MKIAKTKKNTVSVSIALLLMILLVGCDAGAAANVAEPAVPAPETTVAPENAGETTVSTDTTDPTTGNLTVVDATDRVVEETPAAEQPEEPTPTPEPEENETVMKDGKVVVDIIMFMGQSNMSGCGGNAAEAPVVKPGAAYEFRAISDPTRLYSIAEPFGINENQVGGIVEYPGGKKGSLVSAFANTYYQETGVPMIAVSASAGATTTEYWSRQAIIYDFVERHQRAKIWLEGNDYYVRNQYVIWLQGESDADKGITVDQYTQNMDNIIRPLFINGIQKVFIIRPGRTIDKRDYFDQVIKAQTEMCKKSDYYALASTMLSGFGTTYMVDQWHYNQTALNMLGEDAAKNVAYFTNNRKESCMYDYKYQNTYIPEGYDYPENTVVQPITIEPYQAD